MIFNNLNFKKLQFSSAYGYNAYGQADLSGTFIPDPFTQLQVQPVRINFQLILKFDNYKSQLP